MLVRIVNKKIVRFFFGLALIAFIFVALFGLSHGMAGMEKRSDGTMGGCLFNGQTEVCTMNFSEHIALWEGMMTTLPQEVGVLSLLVLALLLVVIVTFWQDSLFEFSERVASRWRLYVKQNPHAHLFNSLIEEFSQGILNPKIFASATI